MFCIATCILIDVSHHSPLLGSTCTNETYMFWSITARQTRKRQRCNQKVSKDTPNIFHKVCKEIPMPKVYLIPRDSRVVSFYGPNTCQLATKRRDPPGNLVNKVNSSWWIWNLESKNTRKFFSSSMVFSFFVQIRPKKTEQDLSGLHAACDGDAARLLRYLHLQIHANSQFTLQRRGALEPSSASTFQRQVLWAETGLQKISNRSFFKKNKNQKTKQKKTIGFFLGGWKEILDSEIPTQKKRLVDFNHEMVGSFWAQIFRRLRVADWCCRRCDRQKRPRRSNKKLEPVKSSGRLYTSLAKSNSQTSKCPKFALRFEFILVKMVYLVNMVNPTLFPKNNAQLLLYFHGEFEWIWPISSSFRMIFDTKLPKIKVKLQSKIFAKFLSVKEVKPFQKSEKFGCRWILDFAAKNIGQRNAFWAAVTSSPMTAASRPTTHWGKFPRGHRGFAPSVSRGMIIYTVADCQSSKDWSFCLCKQKECCQQDSWKLKVIENGSCKSSNASKALYQKHQEYQKYQSIKSSMQQACSWTQPPKENSPEPGGQNLLAPLKIVPWDFPEWFMVWYGSTLKQSTYDNLFLVNKPSRGVLTLSYGWCV